MIHRLYTNLPQSLVCFEIQALLKIKKKIEKNEEIEKKIEKIVALWNIVCENKRKSLIADFVFVRVSSALSTDNGFQLKSGKVSMNENRCTYLLKGFLR